MTTMAWMTIARAAEAAGVGVETIRFYERRGLIARPRKPAQGFRDYDGDTVRRIRFIRQAQELGFSLREIGELLALRTDPAGDCADVRAQAIAKRGEVERKIAELERIRAALGTVIASCPGRGRLPACTILDAIERIPVTPERRRPARKPAATAPAVDRQRRARNAMKTETFHIDGMHCAGCAETVRALLRIERGVQTCAVSYPDRTARVLFDPAATDEARLIAAIERGGYTATRQAP